MSQNQRQDITLVTMATILGILVAVIVIMINTHEKASTITPNEAELEETVAEITTEEITTDPFKYSYDVPLPQEYINLTVTVAEQYGLKPALVFAVMKQESNFDCMAENGNCVGLMQIHSCNYEELKLMLGVNNLMNPEQNIESGCYILSKLLDKYSLERALVCYNCGENANSCKSTEYSRNVIQYMNEYEG